MARIKVGVNQRQLYILVPENSLNGYDIDPGHDQMTGGSVTEIVYPVIGGSKAYQLGNKKGG
jgi:hypothetical protein